MENIHILCLYSFIIYSCKLLLPFTFYWNTVQGCALIQQPLLYWSVLTKAYPSLFGPKTS